MTAHPDTVSIELPESLVKRVEHRLPHTEFNSVDTYVAYVLNELMYELEDEAPRDAAATVDEDQVRSQLRALGYVDE